MIVLSEKEVRLLRETYWSEKSMNKIPKILRRLDEKLQQIIGIRLGESCCLMKRIRTKKGKLRSLPTNILDCHSSEWWYCHVSGYDPETKCVIISRYYRHSNNPFHHKLPSIYFLKPLGYTKELLKNAQKKSDR